MRPSSPELSISEGVYLQRDRPTHLERIFTSVHTPSPSRSFAGPSYIPTLPPDTFLQLISGPVVVVLASPPRTFFFGAKKKIARRTRERTHKHTRADLFSSIFPPFFLHPCSGLTELRDRNRSELPAGVGCGGEQSSDGDGGPKVGLSLIHISFPLCRYLSPHSPFSFLPSFFFLPPTSAY